MLRVVRNRANYRQILASFSSSGQEKSRLCRDMFGKKRQDGDPWTLVRYLFNEKRVVNYQVSM